jgi:hypothetical protein
MNCTWERRAGAMAPGGRGARPVPGMPGVPGTPPRPAAARMKATAAYRAYCQKSSACHQATSSSRSGSVPP